MECISKDLLDLDNGFYLVTGILGVMTYWPVFKADAYFRPAWVPIVVFTCLQKMQLIPWCMELLLCISVVTDKDVSKSLGWRLTFALVVSALDLVAYSRQRWHVAFINLYCTWIMVLPGGPGRRGALLIVVLHNFMSSGLSKIRVGGKKYFDGETLQLYFREIIRAYQLDGYSYMEDTFWGWLQAKMSNRFVLIALAESPKCCSVLAVCAVAAQVLVIPLTMIVPAFRHAALFLIVSFILGVVFIFGFVFPFHIPCAIIALWPQSHFYLLNVPTVLVAVVMGLASVLQLETWPLNQQCLFPYNYEQLQRILDIAGGRVRFVLVGDSNTALLNSETQTDRQIPQGYSSLCVVCACVSGDPVPSVYHHGLVNLVGGFAFDSHTDPDDAAVAARLDTWVLTNKMFFDEHFNPFTGVKLEYCM